LLVMPGLPRMSLVKRDKNWECYLSLSQQKYAGKYVVIAGGELVGAGRDLPILVQRARKAHPKETPFVARVRDPRKVYVYLGRLNG